MLLRVFAYVTGDDLQSPCIDVPEESYLQGCLVDGMVDGGGLENGVPRVVSLNIV